MTANSLVDALAFLYLTFGQATDGTLTADEMRTLAGRLQKRAPALSLEDLGQVLRPHRRCLQGARLPRREDRARADPRGDAA